MTSRSLRLKLRLSSGLALVATALAVAPATPTTRVPVVTKRAVLPQIAMSSIQPSIANDRAIKLGSIGSGLFRINADEYWTITDRGPNADAGDLKTFILPEFTPHLVRIRVRGNTLDVRQSIAITTPDGEPVTGLPNFPKKDDPKPVLSDGTTDTNYNPNGIDTEGVVRTADGHFWIVEEYGPSILELDRLGHVLQRFVPAGTESSYSKVAQLDGSTVSVAYPVIGSLPSGLSKRRANRGFEDIVLMPDGHTVVVALQSPIDKSSLVTRLVTFDTTPGRATGSVGYQFDDPSTFDSGEAESKDLKISALVPIDSTHIAVEERTDDEARFYIVAPRQPDGVIAGSDKFALADLGGLTDVPGKIEGAAFRGRHTLIVIADNDFGFTNKLYPVGADVDSSKEPTILAAIRLR